MLALSIYKSLQILKSSLCDLFITLFLVTNTWAFQLIDNTKVNIHWLEMFAFSMRHIIWETSNSCCMREDNFIFTPLLRPVVPEENIRIIRSSWPMQRGISVTGS